MLDELLNGRKVSANMYRPAELNVNNYIHFNKLTKKEMESGIQREKGVFVDDEILFPDVVGMLCWQFRGI